MALAGVEARHDGCSLSASTPKLPLEQRPHLHPAIWTANPTLREGACRGRVRSHPPRQQRRRTPRLLHSVVPDRRGLQCLEQRSNDSPSIPIRRIRRHQTGGTGQRGNIAQLRKNSSGTRHPDARHRARKATSSLDQPRETRARAPPRQGRNNESPHILRCRS